MTYLFAAYAVFWALTFAFVFRIHARQAQLSRQLTALRQALDRLEEPDG
jgi:CcmD family protein